MIIPGFSIQFTEWKDGLIFFITIRPSKQVISNWLISRLIRYPLIPSLGCAFPKPLIMLLKVVVMYKKGHIQAKAISKSPASSFLKITFPSSLPKVRKTPILNMPINMLYFIDRSEVFRIVS